MAVVHQVVAAAGEGGGEPAVGEAAVEGCEGIGEVNPD